MPQLTPVQVLLFQKAWQALSGFVTALLVTQYLTTDEQGYYYVIGSLLSAYTILDLGLAGLLVQISARMFTGLNFAHGGKLEPIGERRSAYLSMLNWSRRWYTRISFFVLLLIPVGFCYFFFAKSSHNAINWGLPWIFAVVTAALSMSVSSRLSIVEGAGRIAEVYWVRFAHYALGALLGWALIIDGNSLYAPAMPALAISLTTTVWFRFRYQALLEDSKSGKGFCWRKEVWPLQKRVAVSWIVSYVFLSAPTLIVFYYLDSVSAGQLGFTSVVANVLGSLCASWLTAMVPRITSLASMGKLKESRVLFSREFRKALLLMTLSYSIVALLIAGIGHLRVAERFTPPLETAFLFAAFMIFHSVGMLSLYFRAFGREFLAYPSAVAILLSLILPCLIAPNLDLTKVVIIFFCCYVFICIPAMIIGWRKMHNIFFKT